MDKKTVILDKNHSSVNSIIKNLYEKEGLAVSNIANYLNNNGVKKEKEDSKWTGTNIGFICKKNNFVWGGKTINAEKNKIINNKFELIDKIRTFKRKDTGGEKEFLHKLGEGKPVYFQGSKLIKGSLKYFFEEEEVYLFLREKIEVDKITSTKELLVILEKEFPKGDGDLWTKQELSRKIKEIKKWN